MQEHSFLGGNYTCGWCGKTRDRAEVHCDLNLITTNPKLYKEKLRRARIREARKRELIKLLREDT